MKTPQFNVGPQIADVGQAATYSLSFTKAQVAELHFGIKSFQVAFNFTATRSGATSVWARTIVAKMGEQYSLDYNTGQAFPIYPAYTSADESVLKRTTIHEEFDSGNPREEFRFVLFTTVWENGTDGLYYPDFRVICGSEKIGASIEIESHNRGSMPPLSGVLVTLNLRSGVKTGTLFWVPVSSGAPVSITGGIVVTPTYW